MPVAEHIEHTVVVDAPPHAVWDALTSPEAMRVWMGEPEMDVRVETEWVVGGPIVVRGFHHAAFENRGRVLRFEPDEHLCYSYRSSLSGLPDVPESQTTFDFVLTPSKGKTTLTLTVRGFPDEVIFKHHQLYWRVTVEVLARFVESRRS